MRIFCVVIAMFAVQVAGAQEDLVPDVKRSLQSDAEVKEGWSPKLNLGANISKGSSKDVVGQTDGDTTTLGLNMTAGLSYKAGSDEWRNSLKVLGATTRSPSIPRYVKSSDELKLESIYLHSLQSRPWLGPYAKVSAETAMFAGEDVREKDYQYRFDKDNGGQPIQYGDSLRLTDGFKPLTTKESVGAFAKLIDRKKTKLEFRAGIGAMQVKADDQLAVNDDSTTENDIEIKRLGSYSQSGFELGLLWSGQFDAKSEYSVGVESLTPFSSDEGDDRSTTELTNVDAVAKVTSKLYEWAAVSYEFKAKKQPKLVSQWQIQHLLVLNFTHTIF